MTLRQYWLKFRRGASGRPRKKGELAQALQTTVHMTLFLCRSVPVFTFSMLVLMGCFGVHESPPEEPLPDAGSDAQVMPPIGAVVCPEGSAAVGAPRPEVALSEGLIVDGDRERLHFRLLVPGCYCGSAARCSARFSPAENRFELHADVCRPSEGPLCDGCSTTFQGEGLYANCDVDVSGFDVGEEPIDVYVNGEPGFVLSAPWTSGSPGTLYEIARVPGDEYMCAWPGNAASSVDVCFDEQVLSGSWAAIYIREECPGCSDSYGLCEVQVDRSSGIIRVESRSRACSCSTCGACDDVCRPTTRICRSPILTDEADYRVVVNGEDRGTLRVNSAPPEPPAVSCRERFGDERDGPVSPPER